MRAKFIHEGVGDKYLLNKYGMEDKFSKIKNKHYFFGVFYFADQEVLVYKNPETLKIFPFGARACSDQEGNLYIADNQDILHYNLALFLIKKGVDGNYIDWQRYEKTDKFFLAEGYDLNDNGLEEELTPEEKETIDNYAPVVVSNHPAFTFIWDRTILNSD